jgi:hypothetical protein
MKQQWFVVSDEEMIELQVEGRHVEADAIQVRGDFVDARAHVVSSIRIGKCHGTSDRYSTPGRFASDGLVHSLVLSLSTDERLPAGSWFDKPVLSETLIVRQAQDER